MSYTRNFFRSMPSPDALKPDWTEIKRAYQDGEGTFSELAERFSVSFHTLAKRAKSGNWTGKNCSLAKLVQTSAQHAAIAEGQKLGLRAARFTARTMTNTEDFLTKIEKLAKSPGLTGEKLNSLVSAWRMTVTTGRQVFGLDNDEPTKSYSIQIHGADVKQIADKSEVIDVESTPDNPA
jgi:hypothetical protein